MSGLQTAFYIIGIIYMGLMLLLVIALVIGVFIIRNKINRIHDRIEAKLNMVTNIAERGGEIAGLATRVVARKARKAVRKVAK
jgi:hypothetical protein